MPAHRIVDRGISHAPEGRKVFSTLTVQENLNMGAYSRHDKQGIEESRQRVFRLFPRLQERQRQIAGTLSGGEQQMLAMARALMSHPKLLMLDEPSLGLAPMLVRAIFDTIREINQQGVTILLVEQNVRAALELASRAYLLENGRIVGQGTGQDLLSYESVRSAYLV
jgi:branched-chain amino acid transport system ATP-binding protein